MELLYLLEDLRSPVLNNFMMLITGMGEETAFLVAAMIVFWCEDKQKGYFVLTVGLMGTILNQFLKLLFRIPRPWILDPEFSIVEQAREAASGFSFPSGHSTSAVGTFGAIGYASQNHRVKWACYAVCMLVPFSRMYLGVHTPADVLVGTLLSVVLILLLGPMIRNPGKISWNKLLPVMMVFAVVLLLFAKYYPFAIEEAQLHNLESGMKNAYTMIGTVFGLMLVYPLEKKYVNFETKAVWWVQILKVVLGFLVVLAVKEGLRTPLDSLFGGHLAARSVRYALIVLMAGLVWPMTFRWFSKIGAK